MRFWIRKKYLPANALKQTNRVVIELPMGSGKSTQVVLDCGSDGARGLRECSLKYTGECSYVGEE